MDGQMEDATLTAIAQQMTSIAAGNIVLKYESGGTFRKVELAPYSIARHAVTEAQYAAVMGQGAVAAERADQPVVEVSWLDAVAFCNRLSGAAMLQPCYAIDGENVVCDFAAHGYRLPTEAEWEYACRAGSNAVRYGELDEIGWHAGNSAGRLHPVGGKSANAFGLYDTIGNAWEWCWDLYDPDVYGAYRVFRGGGWLDAPHACRASCRRKSHPTYRIDDLGFRLAQTI